MDLPWLRDEIAARIVVEPSETTFMHGHHARINNLQDSADIAALVSIPGAGGDNVTTPDTVLNSVVGDIDIRAYIAPADWTPASTQTPISKRGAAGSLSWEFSIISTGAIRLIHSADGTISFTDTSSAVPGFVDGTLHWVRATLLVDDGADNYITRFYTSEDGKTWIQLGTDIVVAGATSIFDNAVAVEIGSANNVARVFIGDVYRAEVRDGIEGPVVVQFSPEDAASWTGVFGETWTVNGNATTALIYATVIKGPPAKAVLFVGIGVETDPFPKPSGA